jgi:hypothetical protein
MMHCYFYRLCRLHPDKIEVLTCLITVLPGGRPHSHFPQMWQFKKIIGRGKFVAVSGHKVAVKGPKKFKYGRRKYFLNPKAN